MSENFKDKIQGLELENFTCFAKAKMEFSSGINVLIGENGTGKTHVLKVLDSNYRRLAQSRIDPFASQGFDNNIENYFDKNNYNKLDRIAGSNPFVTRLKTFSGAYILQESHRNLENAASKTGPSGEMDGIFYSENSNTLFIPVQDMLAWQNGFISLYLDRYINFDKTFFDLAVALDRNLIKKNEFASILKEIEDDIEGTVIRKEDNRFYFKENKGNEILAVFNAQGKNKLGQLIYLIKNGSINKNTILFWDEPEVNLNPRYIAIVVKFLQTLAKNGVQIFVATHDYLLAHLLSLDAEYREQTDAPPMKFFSFYKGEDGTEIESADTIAGLQNNALLDEYAAYYDLEQSLFRKSMQNV
jgi:predicted ATP-dependent endonuclease of OLD family